MPIPSLGHPCPHPMVSPSHGAPSSGLCPTFPSRKVTSSLRSRAVFGISWEEAITIWLIQGIVWRNHAFSQDNCSELSPPQLQTPSWPPWPSRPPPCSGAAWGRGCLLTQLPAPALSQRKVLGEVTAPTPLFG